VIRLLAVLAWLSLATTGSPISPPDSGSLAALKFLEGKWVGEGSSEIGKGSGYATFEQDLQGKVFVRRNHAEYPSSDGKSTYAHDDLMIIYVDTGKGVRAFYTDNESHVIQYNVSVSPDGNTATFLSDADGNAPRYRLTYTRTAPDTMTISLEMTQGADTAGFHRIVEGKMVKVAAGKTAAS